MVFFASILPLAAADEKTRIEGLITHIEGLKDANFIRNGKSYDSKNAAKFLRGKWEAKARKSRLRRISSTRSPQFPAPLENLI
jgi:hypothetical protein